MKRDPVQSKSSSERNPNRFDSPARAKSEPGGNPAWRSLALSPSAIQTQLGVSQAGDASEQEADHVAAQLMTTSQLQPGGPAASTAAEKTEAPPVASEALDSPSTPIDQTTREFMESRFGHEFRDVRVHADARAADAAASVGARAYTVDHDIVFGAGEYAPQTDSGRRLLSHELTHVVQQQSGIHPQLQRQPTGQPPAAVPAATAAPALPSAEELTTRIAQCIGIWETNRGQNAPAPKESSLDTVAGLHASMATIEQATMPYAITALKGHKDLRDKATPALTMKELNDAEARCVAVVSLLSSVATASSNAQTPDDFIKDNSAAITASGLSDADVRTMFSAITLKGTLEKARTDIKAAEDAAKQQAVTEKKSVKEQKAAGKAAAEKTMKDSIAAISATDRLGLAEGSLKAYINKPKNWGEHTVGWQRKAVNAMPNNVGARIQAVAVSDSGTALAIPVIRSRVDAELAKTPVPGKDDIVKTVAQKNNPNETDYGKNVLATYDRLYP